MNKGTPSATLKLTVRISEGWRWVLLKFRGLVMSPQTRVNVGTRREMWGRFHSMGTLEQYMSHLATSWSWKNKI